MRKKLSNEDIDRIIAMRSEGYALIDISAILNISKHAVWYFCHTKNKRQLDELTVSYIKWHLLVGVATCLLMQYFKVGRTAIRNIANGVTWPHVQPNPNAPPLSMMIEHKKPIRLRGERLQAKFKERSQAK